MRVQASEIPASLVKSLSEEEAREVSRWWGGLRPAERRTLRRDAGRPPRRLVARFAPHEHDPRDTDDPEPFYEFLVNHEVLLDDGRTFHICSAHRSARAVVAAGRIPADFSCPFRRDEASCPMRGLLELAPGCDVHLTKRGGEEA
ncbi:MAG TPA: hypothetical protein VGI39_25935 [Polyangiaceae bacterium]|jgi:hypothetical protein